MSKRKVSSPGAPSHEHNEEVFILRKISRLTEILVRLNLHSMRGDRNQGAMISMLNSVGCRPSEIADLVGTTANTVNVTLSKTKNKAKKT
jgi:hypothetical protein